MAVTKFKYDLKTLRYERAGISILGVTFRVIGYLSFGSLFLVALVLLQNSIFDTELETKLRAENEALESHQVILASRLQASSGRIERLKSENKDLYEKLFETTLETGESDPTAYKEEILTANSSSFANWMTSVVEKSEMVSAQAKTNNYYFSESASIEKHELRILKNLPTIPPIQNFEVDKLVSGFGRRINPFHKGLDSHEGVDIAATIGTNVLASGPGLVVNIGQSNLLAGYGTYIDIDHGKGIVTRYAHLAEVKIRYGQRVTKEQIIGTIGSTGGSIAPHLHYEVIKDGHKVNPVKYMIGGLSSTEYQQMVNNSNKLNQSLD